MQFAILGSADSWYFKDLQRAADGMDHQLTALPFSSISATVGQQGQRITAGQQALHQFDAVLVRTMPPGSLEQVVFRMDVLDSLSRQGIL